MKNWMSVAYLACGVAAVLYQWPAHGQLSSENADNTRDSAASNYSSGAIAESVYFEGDSNSTSGNGATSIRGFGSDLTAGTTSDNGLSEYRSSTKVAHQSNEHSVKRSADPLTAQKQFPSGEKPGYPTSKEQRETSIEPKSPNPWGMEPGEPGSNTNARIMLLEETIKNYKLLVAELKEENADLRRQLAACEGK